MDRSGILLLMLALCALLVHCSGTPDPPATPVPVDTETAFQDAGPSAGMPATFTNLQVLPADIGRTELKQTMKLITRSLGTKCDHCHNTRDRDYASDDKKEKVTAREMMRMVERINSEHFTWEGAPEATCFMCHHGRTEPLTQPDPGD